MASSSKSKVYFFYETAVTLKERTRLKRFIESIFKSEKRDLDTLNYIFCTDKRLLEINRQYLNHDYYTDIITFELSGKDEAVQGEIYISMERVNENARNIKQFLSTELLRVIFHGTLHLCGYKDKTSAQTRLMRAKEDHYLKKYNPKRST